MITVGSLSRTIVVGLSLAILAAGSRRNGGQPDVHGFTPDDYSIYALVVADAAARLDSGFVVTGLKRNTDWRGYFPNALHRVPVQYEVALQAFLAIDTVKVDWTGLKSQGFRVVDREIANAGQHVVLGPIGYDSGRHKAIVYCSTFRGNLGAEGHLVLMSVRAGRWEITDSIGIWTS